MTSKAPPIPPEQRSFKGQKPDVAGGAGDRRDETTGLQSGQPGDGDANFKLQGRTANIRQNTRHPAPRRDP
jgi:hypothetical protein